MGCFAPPLGKKVLDFGRNHVMTCDQNIDTEAITSLNSLSVRKLLDFAFFLSFAYLRLPLLTYAYLCLPTL